MLVSFMPGNDTVQGRYKCVTGSCRCFQTLNVRSKKQVYRTSNIKKKSIFHPINLKFLMDSSISSGFILTFRFFG